MHELGIMQATIELVEQQARIHAARQIHRITLRIGALAGVEIEALRFAFEVVTQGTIAAGAAFDVVPVPVKARCRHCASDFAADAGAVFSCPTCGGFSGEVLEGRELELSQIEMS